MHPSVHARTTPDKPALIMAGSGQSLTYAQLPPLAVRFEPEEGPQGSVVGELL